MIETILIGGFVLLLVLALIGKLFEKQLRRLDERMSGNPATPAPIPAPAPAPPPAFTRPPPEGDRVRFGYRDREGRDTIRLVTPIQLTFFDEPNGDHGINGFTGYCHDARDTRTFRVDRMTNAYVFDTGEVLADAAAIQKWLAEELPTPSGRRRRKPRYATRRPE
ncbi:WYL domain-containing protein [Pseudoroseomonas cervicalis]|uniref:WYL domain-containing protein n=1 Tax=Teichococcus cervicalis TaxID=204525 RepID=UPI00277E70DE|nr:WYL domain-containing protein [Pseudoroseomonas cervicalis]MDQ1079714.1 hypothetical protein [Pseudoroseomonas cervicalis]